MNKTKKPRVQSLEELQEYKYYRVGDLQTILKNMGLNFSIYSIRDAESWTCINKECKKRHDREVSKCEGCGGEVKAPIIPSPRTPGGGVSTGHRRYTAADIKKVVEVFSATE